MDAAQAADLAATNAPAAIPWNQIGAKAGADYQGDGLAVTPAGSGARLHCVFQRLDGEATPEGLWLTSTVTNTVSDRFRVTAMAVGRKADDATFNFQATPDAVRLGTAPAPGAAVDALVRPCRPGALTGRLERAGASMQSLFLPALAPTGEPRSQDSASGSPLPAAGEVSVCGQTVRFSRPGLTEEYSVSLDGVRQDFIVEQAPPRPPAGELVVKLAVSGAQVEAAADGARLVLDNSGRKMAYSRLRVTDATGKELPARMEVASDSDVAASRQSAAAVENKDGGGLPTRRYTRLAVVVNDADAVYPVRIDPTFSDANWVSMGGLPGANGQVNAAVIDGSGNLYIGGNFTIVGNAIATNIAQWNGSSWSALGSGMDGDVFALAVSGSTLYAGGDFTTAGGSAANYIAQWNGSSWSALGSGVDSHCACAGGVGRHVVCGRLFHDGGRQRGQLHRAMEREQLVGARFGDGRPRGALAVSGGTLYAGGYFTTAGGSAANYIAQWNGSSWSALGSGMNGAVDALAVSGEHVVCGRRFHDGGRQRGQLHRAMEREQLVGPGFGDERRCVCAGGVRQHVVCGRRFQDGGRQRGQFHRAMEREQLVGARFGDGRRVRQVLCAGGVGQHVVCGRHFHDGGRQRGQLHRAMEREQLVCRSVRG